MKRRHKVIYIRALKLARAIVNYAGLLFLAYAAFSAVQLRVLNPLTLSINRLDASSQRALLFKFPHRSVCDSQALESLTNRYRSKGSSAIIVIKNDSLELDWGRTSKKINSHSVRKSMLSALFGIAIEKGLVEQDATLLELGINDRFPSLSDEQRAATVRNLLESRSGIYHAAAAQTRGQRRRFPSTTKPAGEHWAYNNWDYNALGTIFENQTGLKIGEAFETWIAEPSGMVDFNAADVRYLRDIRSSHPSFPVWISSRDLAVFAKVMMSDGIYEDKIIVPSAWVRESTKPQAETYRGGNGLMWWISNTTGGVFASGTGTQKVYYNASKELIIVHRVDTGSNHIQNFVWFMVGKRVSSSDFFSLVDQVEVACS